MFEDYSNWNLYDKVKVVVRKSADVTRGMIESAYIVDADNKKSFESAYNWAEVTQYINGHSVKIEPEILEYKNEGFKIRLMEAANGSYQGGKLSFWNCVISKDGRDFLVGINSQLLLTLLMQCKCENGVIEQEVAFARKSGNLGVLHTGMKEYTDAIKDRKIKENVKSSKVTKHVVGYEYKTLRDDSNVYIGDVYTWVKCTKTENRYTYNIELLDKPERLKLFPSMYLMRELLGQENSIEITELFERDRELMLRQEYKQRGDSVLDSVQTKLPARVQGNKIVNGSLTEEQLEEYIKAMRILTLNQLKNVKNKRLFLNRIIVELGMSGIKSAKSLVELKELFDTEFKTYRERTLDIYHETFLLKGFEKLPHLISSGE